MSDQNRVLDAVRVYTAAMQKFVAERLAREHGTDWIRSQVLDRAAEERDPSQFRRRTRALDRGQSPDKLIESGDFPFLVEANNRAFPELERPTISDMHRIARLRNDASHSARQLTADDATEAEVLCRRVLKACELFAAADSVANSTDTATATDVSGTSEAEAFKRQFIRRTLDSIPVSQRTLTQEQLLLQYRADEAWKDHQLSNRERAELADLGDDVTRVRTWFESDPQRKTRHEASYVTLQQREQREQDRKETERREREEQERRRQERERLERQRHQQRLKEQIERKQKEEQRRQETLRRERVDYRNLGPDLAAQEAWFRVSAARVQRHTQLYQEFEEDQYRSLGSDLEARARWFTPTRVRRYHREYRALQRDEYASLGSDLQARVQWFKTDNKRAGLLQQEYLQLERDEYASLSSDLQARVQWFESDRKRADRFPQEYLQLERDEYASLGSDPQARTQWFKTDKTRTDRFPQEYLQVERDEYVSLGSDLQARTQWFKTDNKRAGLFQQEYLQLERDEYASLGSELGARAQWFTSKPERIERHRDGYVELLHEEYMSIGPELDAARRWFEQVSDRKTYLPVEHTEVERRLRELTAEREQLRRLDPAPTVRREWFNEAEDRRSRYLEEYQTLLESEKRQAAREAARARIDEVIRSELLLRRMRYAGATIGIVGVAATIGSEVLIGFDDIATLLVVRGVTMIASILFVTSLSRWQGRIWLAAVLGFVVAAGLLDEPFDSAVAFVEDAVAGNVAEGTWRAVLAFPALVVATQLDVMLHEYGAFTAALAGLVAGGSVAVLNGLTDGKTTNVSNVSDEENSTERSWTAYVGDCVGALALTGVGGPVVYALVHVVGLIVFLILFGIPFAIVDIFADVDMDRDIVQGDGYVLWTLLLTSVVIGKVIVPILSEPLRSFAPMVSRSDATAAGKVSSVGLLMVAAVPSGAMICLLAFPDFYFRQMFDQLLKWAS